MIALPMELQVARVLLLKGRPYLATATWALQPVPTDAPDVKGTLGVDKHWRLYYDPAVLPKWTPEALAGVLYHELHHLLRKHHARAELLGLEYTDDPVNDLEVGSKLHIVNLAEDCEINDDLETEHVKLPPIDYATPAKFKLKPNELWETYYQELLKNAPTKYFSICGAQGCGSCADGKRRAYELPGKDKRAPGVSEAEGDLIIRKTAADVLEYARSRGTVPASLRRWAENLLAPKVPWRRVLQGEIRRAVSVSLGLVDYSFRRPRRRDSQPFLLPGLVQPVPNVAFIGDTSGSIGERELQSLVLAEVKGIVRALGRGTLTFLDVDAEVHGVQRIQSERQVQLRGGGGTDMRVGIERACALKPQPSLVVIATDGETPWPDAAATVRCLAVVPVGAPATPGWMRRIEVSV